MPKLIPAGGNVEPGLREYEVLFAFCVDRGFCEAGNTCALLQASQKLVASQKSHRTASIAAAGRRRSPEVRWSARNEGREQVTTRCQPAYRRGMLRPRSRPTGWRDCR